MTKFKFIDARFADPDQNEFWSGCPVQSSWSF